MSLNPVLAEVHWRQQKRAKTEAGKERKERQDVHDAERSARSIRADLHPKGIKGSGKDYINNPRRGGRGRVAEDNTNISESGHRT